MYRPTAAAVELDFLGVGNTTTMTDVQRGGAADTLPKSPFQKFLERGRSFRGIQARDVTCNLLTSEVLKSVIAASRKSPENDTNAPEKPKPKPMTVFYAGSVAVFDVTPDKFEGIVKLAMEEKFRAARGAEEQKQQLLNVEAPLNEDLPIARRKSLQRFLEKRKERLNTVSPYGCQINNY